MSKPKFRYKEYPIGWVVEYGYVVGFWIFKRIIWKHYVSVSGIESQPWYHSDIDYAIMNLKSEVHFQAAIESEGIKINNMEIKNWKDLKDFANSLSEEQLNHEVVFWSEEHAGKLVSVYVLKEDYINVSGEGVEPRSLYKGEEGYDEPATYVKGTPILNQHF